MSEEVVALSRDELQTLVLSLVTQTLTALGIEPLADTPVAITTVLSTLPPAPSAPAADFPPDAILVEAVVVRPIHERRRDYAKGAILRTTAERAESLAHLGLVTFDHQKGGKSDVRS